MASGKAEWQKTSDESCTALSRELDIDFITRRCCFKGWPKEAKLIDQECYLPWLSQDLGNHYWTVLDTGLSAFKRYWIGFDQSTSTTKVIGCIDRINGSSAPFFCYGKYASKGLYT
jgi:hypothetical protein